MKREDAVLLASARQDFTPAHRAAVEALARAGPLDWEQIAGAAERHGVAPLIATNLKTCDAGLPDEVAARLERTVFENVAYKLRESHRLAAALRDLKAVGYEALLLKGAALDLLVYREPWYTVSRDVDLVLRPLPACEPGERERAVRRALYREGIECDLLAHHDVTMSGVLPVPFARVWADARPVRVRGVEAFVMAPADLLLSLAVNACRKRYFRLKSLLDLAEAARRLAVDWDLFGKKARAWQCEGIAYAALAAADATLGCDLPAGALAGLGVHPARRRLIDLLLALLLARGSLVGEHFLGGSARGRFYGRSFEAALLLVYASLRPGQAARSLRGAFTHLPPELRRGPLPALAPPQ